MYVCASSCSCLQGPYDVVALVHGCSGLEGGTTILDVDINCLSDINFSRQFSKPQMFPSFVGHAVSVQNSSGTILGCGRFETQFPVYASYKDKIVFNQLSPYHLTTFMDVAMANWNLFQFTILEGIAGTCSSEAAIFDPWGPPPKQIGPRITPDQFPVGNLRYRQVLSRYLAVPLIGSSTILGHAVCTDHDIND